MKSMDPYATLQVNREAGAEEIKKAYRKLSLKFHPDTSGGDDTAGDKFKEINEAYSTLKDSEKRKEYDLGGSLWGQHDGSRTNSYGRSGAHSDSSGRCNNSDCMRQHGMGQCFSHGGGSVHKAFRHPFSKYHHDRGDLCDIRLTKEEASTGAEKTVATKLGTICVRTQSRLNDGDTLIMKNRNPSHRGGDIYLKVTVVD